MKNAKWTGECCTPIKFSINSAKVLFLENDLMKKALSLQSGTWVQILTLCFAGHGALAKSLSCYRFQFPIQKIWSLSPSY